MAKIHIKPILDSKANATLVNVSIPRPRDAFSGSIKSEFEGAEPSNYELYNIKILVNVGWDLDFSPQILDCYRQLEHIDIILISDAQFEHLGALPWLLKRILFTGGALPLIICTEACYKFARALLVDVLENACFSSDFSHYGHDELDCLFQNVTRVRFRETYCHVFEFDDFACKITVCPLNNGNTIGGALFKVSVGNDWILLGDDVRLYPKWYLNPLDIDGIVNPSVFLTSRKDENADLTFLDTCESMQDLVNVIHTTLECNGSVLIPVDIGGGLIDLLIHLDAAWSRSNLSHYNLVLTSPIADKLTLLYGTCLEYMRSNICHAFFKTLHNPMLNLRNVKYCTDLNQLQRYQYAPSVYISTTSCITFGFVSFLFAGLSTNELNTIVLTNTTESMKDLLSNFGTVDFSLSVNMQRKSMEPVSMPQPLVNRHNNSTIGAVSTNVTTRPKGGFINVGNELVFAPIVEKLNLEPNDQIENYGVPHNAKVLDVGLNPQMQSHVQELPKAPQHIIDRNIFDDYYRKHCGLLLGTTVETTRRGGVVNHPLQLDINCQLYKFDLHSKADDLSFLLKLINPSDAVLVTGNDDVNSMALVPPRNCKVHHCKIDKETTLELSAVLLPVYIDDIQSMALKIKPRIAPVSRVSSSKHDGKGHMQILDVLRKCREMRQEQRYTCLQLVGKLSSALNSQACTGFSSLSFWSDGSNEASYNFTMEPNDDVIQKSNSSTLFCGRIGLCDVLRLLEQMLPHSAQIESGRIHCFSTHLERKNDNWLVQGTLDPSFYLTRKLVRELHYRIEPLY
ncbi:bifunctional Ribonuclease Z-Hydroxyacylglutathione hydrolase-like/Metallo-beta-lactamase/Beta-Casp domain/Cleavage and polyadenylation specificity factor subunit 2 [Babesia duncani]|uniref:Cleavage and polyadenylation specificity factor subunit 2 n=1 Tax=Babesia duncani TaxID=323732 RepID=A0AAD9UN23_9APIC|nr:bifunctional Ribonuclease Z-Hydroxyacylglutathione hydrolase-like/Metallo-beta-lactamase/Beta-Casp domain/Cleavage and polyadenylation specificity factor subunit 2 [Babesia duncani]